MTTSDLSWTILSILGMSGDSPPRQHRASIEDLDERVRDDPRALQRPLPLADTRALYLVRALGIDLTPLT